MTAKIAFSWLAALPSFLHILPNSYCLFRKTNLMHLLKLIIDRMFNFSVFYLSESILGPLRGFDGHFGNHWKFHIIFATYLCNLASVQEFASFFCHENQQAYP